MNTLARQAACLGFIAALTGCDQSTDEPPPPMSPGEDAFIGDPLITDIFAAAPAAHVFDNRLYVYATHDTETDLGKSERLDYHPLSMAEVGGPVTHHGPALHIGDVPWARAPLGPPDVAHKDGTYYLYFPAKDDEGLFRIGVATASTPEGPFRPEALPIAGTYSTDPAVFADDDGSYYLYLGAIGDGQLQRWMGGSMLPADNYPPARSPTLLPRMARLGSDMLSLEHNLTEIALQDETGNLINFGDDQRRFSGGIWVHKYQGTYYLSWSTGASNLVQYATSENPYGPFIWRGRLLEPVVGTTTQHSVVQFQDRWYLFYHDIALSGEDHLHSPKVTELIHNPDGSIQTVDSYLGD